MATTKRTAIRRRLAIGRAAHGPPRRGRQASHGLILAPLAATVAATVAATLAVRVGVALAKAERERRAARARRERERQFALLPGEAVADGLKRMALGQLDLVIELLGDGADMSPAKAVHEARKALKRLRALIRLLEDELGAPDYARESAALRHAGRRLAQVRDAEVMVSTLDDLLERHPDKLAHKRPVLTLRGELVAERDRTAQLALGEGAARAEVLAELRAVRGRVAVWRLGAREGIGAVEPALKRLYRQGRRRHRRAARGNGDRPRALHQWRKRVKDLRYAAEMLDRVEPRYAPDGARAKRRRRARKRGRVRREVGYMRELARRADELGELLGEEHDLVLLDARVRAQDNLRGARTRKILLKLISRRRKHLRRLALREGRSLYGRRPKRFLARVRAAHAAALSPRS
jgi:CHAD domain-containing protein